MSTDRISERIETVIVGGGQAGLATGYHLARRGQPFVILDAEDRIGGAWRNRWDSLRLFTPAQYDGLPGWRFPAPAWSYPTKDEMADYLEAYADRFDLPVRTSTRVDRIWRDGGRFIVGTTDRLIEADRVVVAAGAHRDPWTPALASELDIDVVQLHSSEYRRAAQLAEGSVLVVGAGNSGAEIAYEVARTHPTVLAGRDVGQIPVRHGGPGVRLVFPVIRFVGHHVLTSRTPIQRKIGRKVAFGAKPLIRIKSKQLAEAGVERVPKVVGVEDGMPVLEDGRRIQVGNVIWSTGFRQDFSWIDLPVFDADGSPLHDRGIVRSLPGLYFVGLLFQFSESSDVLPGVGRDARLVARHLAAHRPAAEPAELVGHRASPAGTAALAQDRGTA
ncbi:MAG TPA: FAD-dependent oxidoreductase [Gaiellaceae bacterium]